MHVFTPYVRNNQKDNYSVNFKNNTTSKVVKGISDDIFKKASAAIAATGIAAIGIAANNTNTEDSKRSEEPKTPRFVNLRKI